MGIFRLIRKRVKDRLGVSENRYRIEKLEERFMAERLFQNTIFNLFAAPSFTPVGIEEFSSKASSMAIHKNDIMLHHQLRRNAENLEKGLWEYYNIGLEAAQSIHMLVKEYQLVHTSFLDFGSGYGRMARYLPYFFPSSSIHVSDVKSGGVSFQQLEFGYTTISHSEDVASFPEESFDLITALSVFTHLNPKDINAWLERLIGALNNGGALVFTYNDLSKSPKKSENGLAYLEYSEDSNFNYVSDALTDTSSYGTTYVNKEFLRSLSKDLGARISFPETGLTKKQSTAILQK